MTLAQTPAKRRLNRGIESLAISRDFKHLYFLMQSPLDHPNSQNSTRNSRNLRLFKARLDLGLHGSTITVIGECVYQEIPRADFVALTNATDAGNQRDMRVSEMVNIGHERFLVIERRYLSPFL